MEDVSSTFSAPRNKSNLLANDNFTTNKKYSFIKNINEGNLFSMTESDEECAEIFKQTLIKPTKIVSLKRKASKKLKKDQPKKENNDVVMDSLDTDGNSTVENIFQVALNDKRALDIEEVAATCAINENVNQPCRLLTDCQITNRSTNSFTGSVLESGYNSFSDEKSVSYSLFLPFEKELIARTDDQFYNCYSLTKEVLVNVERFLSSSPPPFSGLSNLEQEITNGSALKNLLYPPCTEYLQNNKPTCLISHSTVSSQQNLELNSLKFINHPEKSCLYSTTNDKIVDEPNFCDYDDKVCKDVENEILVTNNHTQINTGPPQYLVEENNCGIGNNGLQVLLTDQDESLPLFEEDNTEFNDMSRSPSNNECKSLHVSDKTCINKMALVSQFLISNELLLDNNSEPQDQIIYDTYEDLTGIHEKKLKSDQYVLDSSKDLFSVTFDLGFCIPDSDDEILEHASNTNKNKTLDLPGSCLDIKEINDANYVSNQAEITRNHVDSSRNRTITISSSEDKHSPTSLRFSLSIAKNKQFMLPGYSQFSLPVGEKVMSTPLFESSILNSKKRKEMPRTLDSTKVNSQSFKETLNSTFDDSRLFIEKTKNGEQINLHQSCHSAGGKISSF